MGINIFKSGNNLCLTVSFYIDVGVWSGSISLSRKCVDLSWLFKAVDWVKEQYNAVKNWVDEQIAKLMAFLGFPTLNFFVTWDWFETICITDGLSTIGKDYASGALEASGLQADDRFKKNVWRLDSTGVTLGYPDGDLFASTNPWVCMLPGMSHWDVAVSLNELDDAADAGIEATSGFESLPKWDGDIKQILLNTGYIWEVYLQSETINDFVMKVAEGVNDACGGFWDLKLVEDPLDPSRLMVVDMKAVNSQKQIPILDLGTVSGDYAAGFDDGMHGRSVAREWGMTSDIDDSIKHSIMMGSNAGSDTAQNTSEPTKVWTLYGQKVTDRMYKGLSCNPECADESKRNKNTDCSNSEGEKSDSDIEGDLGKAMEELSDDITDESIDTATSAMQTYYSGKNEQSTAVSNKDVVIPIGFDAKFDGIGMLYWGESFAVKQIVDNSLLPKGHRFMITDIGHSINRTDWTTKIQTRMVLPQEGASPRYTGGGSGGSGGSGQASSASGGKTKKSKNPEIRQPVANELRECIRDLPNVVEKGVEIDNGGDITECLRDYACSFFTHMNKNYPQMKFRVTGANDIYHHKLSYTSSHTSGDGLDFVIDSGYSTANLDICVKVLGGFHKGAPEKYHWIDEYRKPSKKASGKHLHMRCGVDSTTEKNLGHGKKAIADASVPKLSVTPYA